MSREDLQELLHLIRKHSKGDGKFTGVAVDAVVDMRLQDLGTSAMHFLLPLFNAQVPIHN